MAFGQYNTDGIPSLRSYDQAVAWEAKIKPIRGRAVECKPLGIRTHSHRNIRREDDTIKVRLHRTDIITYHPNGDIMLFTDGWDSPTTQVVISAVLGWNLRPHTFQGRTWITAYGPDGTLGKHLLQRDVPTRLTTSDQGNYYTIHNPHEVVVHRVNRKAANQMRAKYKPFRQFFDSYVALCRETLPYQWRNHTYDGLRLDRDGFKAAFGGDAGYVPIGFHNRITPRQVEANNTLNYFMLSDDPADHHKAMLLLCMDTISHWDTRSTHATLSEVVGKFDTALMFLNRDEVFTTEVAPAGKQTKDRWASFF